MEQLFVERTGILVKRTTPSTINLPSNERKRKLLLKFSALQLTVKFNSEEKFGAEFICHKTILA